MSCLCLYSGERTGDRGADLLHDVNVAVGDAEPRRLGGLALAHLLARVPQRHDARRALGRGVHALRPGKERELGVAVAVVELAGQVAAELDVLCLVCADGHVRRPE